MLRHLSRYKSGGNGVVREYGGRVKDAVSYLFPDALHKYFKRYADPRDADGMLSLVRSELPRYMSCVTAGADKPQAL